MDNTSFGVKKNYDKFVKVPKMVSWGTGVLEASLAVLDNESSIENGGMLTIGLVGNCGREYRVVVYKVAI